MEQRKIIAGIIIILIVLLGIYFFYKKSCKDDECFNEALYKCKPAKYFGYRNNNLYFYKISRSFFSKCKLHVEVERMAIGSERDLIELLEGKSMKCKIPKTVVVSLDEMENLLDYCHGELKEGLLQLMVERLYGLVVRDISGVVKKAEEIIKV